MSKQKRAHDRLVDADVILLAQHAASELGPKGMMRWMDRREPGLTRLIAVGAHDIAGGVMLDVSVPQETALVLRQRILTLAFITHCSYSIAVYQLYCKLLKGTPLAKLDDEPVSSPEEPEPHTGEAEGGTTVET